VRKLVPVLLPGRTMGGTGIPSNVGIDICKRRDPPFTYIAFADADDVLEPDYLSQLVSAAEETQADVVIGNFDLWSRSDTTARKASSEREGWEVLPKGVTLDPMQHFSALAQLMPAPWRKVLRLDYVVKHNLRFPEGDFLYEDNVLHWLIILTARRLVLCPDVLVHHRSSRSLFGEHEIRNAGFFAVINAIGDELLRRAFPNEHVPILRREFFEFVQRSQWITSRQRNVKMRNKFMRCFSRLHRKWLAKLPLAGQPGLLLPSSPNEASGTVSPLLGASTTNEISNASSVNGSFAGDTWPQIDAPSEPPPTGPYTATLMPLDLSVVIPVYNAGPFIASLFSSIDLIRNATYEVFCVDGASTDDSPQIISQLEEARPRMYSIQLLAQVPAGLSRNLVIPLLEGTYVFFLDADDSVDGQALDAATSIAVQQGFDLLMLPYQLAFVSQQGNEQVTTLMGMDKYDHATWMQAVALQSSNATREAAVTLVNYPWNRLARSEFVQAERIFFGTTQVQNDVQYHWHALSAARRVAFLAATAAPVCYHKKFVGSSRMQLTKVKSASRLEMFWALQATHRVLCQSVPDALEDGPGTMAAWRSFARKVTDWAKNSKLVPARSMPEFMRSRAIVFECVNTCSMGCLYSSWVGGSAYSSADEGVLWQGLLAGLHSS
jgi:glycosyltransferase involved in cell wall biosynthesis